jgi:hypothetical protein
MPETATSQAAAVDLPQGGMDGLADGSTSRSFLCRPPRGGRSRGIVSQLRELPPSLLLLHDGGRMRPRGISWLLDDGG